MRIAVFVFTFALVAFCNLSAQTNFNWHDFKSLPVEGKGWTDTKTFYDRLPARAEKKVRSSVWNLSQDSAGMSARFITDADTIWARWTLRKDGLDMPHMPSSGMSGVDLYVREDKGGKWRWVGAARPTGKTNQVAVVRGLPSGEREYMFYLPLYNGVQSVEIGVPPNSKFRPAQKRDNLKPIVFYGTSILQGGCASRPGMAYPSIIGRHLDYPVINLGFSGNAKSEPELAEFLAELDPVLYVIDPVPNMDPNLIDERVVPFIQKLRGARPKTPIVMIESLHYTDGHLDQQRRERFQTGNAAYKRAYEGLKRAGVKNLHYIDGSNLIGDDSEGTVDGVHPTDLGFMRMAEEIGPKLRRFVK